MTAIELETGSEAAGSRDAIPNSVSVPSTRGIGGEVGSCMGMTLRRLVKNSVYTQHADGIFHIRHCQIGLRMLKKAAAIEEARRTLRYVEPLSDARTPLADFFSILIRDSALS